MTKIHLSKQEAEWFYDMMDMNLDESHKVVKRNEIPYGVQLITQAGRLNNLQCAYPDCSPYVTHSETEI